MESWRTCTRAPTRARPSSPRTSTSTLADVLDVRPVQTDEELHAALDLRERVFIGEQGVSAEADRDGRDHESIHIVAVENGSVIGTCRLLLGGGIARLGRLAVDPAMRGRGVGGAILREADRVASGEGADRIALHAQTHAMRLYSEHGYVERGARFMEEGIEHVAMEKRL